MLAHYRVALIMLHIHFFKQYIAVQNVTEMFVWERQGGDVWERRQGADIFVWERQGGRHVCLGETRGRHICLFGRDKGTDICLREAMGQTCLFGRDKGVYMFVWKRQGGRHVCLGETRG